MRSRLLFVAVVVGLVTAPTCGKDIGVAPAGPAVQRGLDALAVGDTGAAVTEFVAALEADPDDTFALYNLGYIAQTNGERASAELYYRAVLDRDADFEAALFNLALLRQEGGGTQEAIVLYRRVIAVNGENAEAHLELGLLLLRAGRTSEAETALRTAVRLDPSLVDRLENGTAGALPSAPAREV
jgi:tetratricopeptide (TPR) repeat protein